MRKNRKKIIIIALAVVLLVVGFVSLMIYLNNSQNNYTFLEKKWIDNNSNNIIDVYVEEDLPVFSMNGSGVFYDFIKDLEIDTGLSFNVSYTSSSPIVLSMKKSIKDTDTVFHKDHYVLVSKTNVYVNDISALGNMSVGVLSDELTDISSNLSKYHNIEYKTYDSTSELIDAFDKKSTTYIIVSLYENLDLFMDNNYSIIYHFDSLNKYFTVDFNNASNELVSIVNKFYNKWDERKEEKFNSYFTELFYNLNNYTEVEKEFVTNDDFIVGYIENMPFEGKINNTFSGLTGHYLEEFSKLTGTTYKYVEYSNLDKLTNALNDKKVDIVYNSYALNNSNYVSTNYIGTKNIVVLVPNESDLIINSIEALKGMNITMVNNRSLKNSFTTKDIFNITEVKDIEELYKSDSEIIIIEKEVYDYYKSNKLKDYKIAYISNEYIYDAFLLNNSNSPLNKLFSFYISITSAKKAANESVISTLKDKNNNLFLSFIVDNAFIIVIILLCTGFIVYRYGNKLRLTKKIKKEDKLLYLDVMTNLKNRNYLNDNIEYWEKNIIYPQTIIILDLNRIKELNDRQGHEAGDNQIKACANVLIKTQRENSEIMRTDGNEFTIYLVGYEEKIIMSYIHKLNKELKNALPHKDYGFSIGYSMITDEIKTIDDAINEALIMVKENKGIMDGKN